MIFLTGDVHFKNKRLFSDQRFMTISEVEAAKKYIRLAERYGVKATLFFTGKSIAEEPDTMKEIIGFKNIEIGGHTYNTCQPEILYRLFKRFNPPLPPFIKGGRGGIMEWWQERDIKKTVKAIKNVTGGNIVSWRNHAYRYDEYTYNILIRHGIKVVSNDVDTRKKFPEKLDNGIFSLPINTTPDHEHLYHGEKKYIEGVKESYGPYSKGIFYFVDKWLEVVKEEIKAIEAEGGSATVLCHPSCMEAADGMKTFDKLCSFLSGYKTAFVKDAAETSFHHKDTKNTKEIKKDYKIIKLKD
ncbi:MAG: polysaccharide deacetylase family protein [Nitrospinae bacterium]|nr:polysaccharide deacetylase family protein [Nitrospinota bacterium]